LPSNDLTTLKNALGEYVNSLVRTDGEKDHQAAIVASIKESCGIEPGHFKKLAMAMHKNKVDDIYTDAGEFLAWIETIRAE
jgi:hypothetical protein